MKIDICQGKAIENHILTEKNVSKTDLENVKPSEILFCCLGQSFIVLIRKSGPGILSSMSLVCFIAIKMINDLPGSVTAFRSGYIWCMTEYIYSPRTSIPFYTM